MNGRPSDLRVDIGHLADESVASVAPDATVGEVAESMLAGSRCRRYVVVTLDDLVRRVAGEGAHVGAQLDNLVGVISAESSTA